MTTTQKPNYFANAIMRSASFLDDQVYVIQGTDIYTLTLEPPTINWPKIETKDAQAVIEFAKALQQAAKVADRWNADTGKAYTEVLK